jgi:hypothetical protein
VVAARFPVPPPRVPGRRTLIIAALVLAVVPLAAAAALRPATGDRSAIQVHGIAVPVSSEVGLRADVRGGVIHLRWSAVSRGSTRVFYKLLRHRGRLDTFCPGSGGASKCFYWGGRLLTTRSTRATDRPSAPGVWTYRLAVGANWVDNSLLGDIFLVSRPVVVLDRLAIAKGLRPPRSRA